MAKQKRKSRTKDLSISAGHKDKTNTYQHSHSHNGKFQNINKNFVTISIENPVIFVRPHFFSTGIFNEHFDEHFRSQKISMTELQSDLTTRIFHLLWQVQKYKSLPSMWKRLWWHLFRHPVHPKVFWSPYRAPEFFGPPSLPLSRIVVHLISEQIQPITQITG